VRPRRGFTLLEAMVALVILGLVVLGYLELFGTTVRAAGGAESWSQAVAYAEDGMERVKLDPEDAVSRGGEVLPGGFERRVQSQPWRNGLQHVTVVVMLPGGGELALSRLVEMR
jgi:prepilin-type N-terminal cleavage/methylation domain-containing protein